MAALLDLLVPPACSGCGAVGGLLCAACRDRFTPPSRAEDRFVAPDAAVVLGTALTLAVAAHEHAGPLRRALAQLKYEGVSRLAPLLARECLPALRRLLAVAGPATLVPVPVHRERQRARGYNQAALIARELSRAARLPYADLLVRTRPTTKQHRLDRAARLHNLRDAFMVRPGPLPWTVIVVDDIVTTNATLEACASVLTDAGCTMVYGLAVAREV